MASSSSTSPSSPSSPSSSSSDGASSESPWGLLPAARCPLAPVVTAFFRPRPPPAGCVAPTMPGSLWVPQRVKPPPGMPKRGWVVQPEGWLQRLLATSTMPASLWAEHLEARPPGSPKRHCLVHPSGWLQRLLTTSSMPVCLWAPHRVAELPGKPKLGCFMQPLGWLQSPRHTIPGSLWDAHRLALGGLPGPK